MSLHDSNGAPAGERLTTQPLTPQATRMHRETAEAPQVVRRLLDENRTLVESLAARLRATPPRAVVTFARGSSDNAATYARYLIETRLGVMTSSAAPSVPSVYDAAPAMQDVLCLVISQSGRSPDLLTAADAAAQAGAYVVALVNDEASPLAAQADLTIPLRAGPEISVAATKSCIAAFAAAAQLVACWGEDQALLAELDALPDLLADAAARDWSPARERLLAAQSLYVLGRGLGFGVAQEAALKLKETCGLHAEAFSAAEVRHGPMALVGPEFPVLAFAQDDETRQGVDEAALACARQGATVLKAGGAALEGVVALPSPAAAPALEPIAQLQSFYRMACELALARGFDPDHPPHLSKVTRTT